MNVRLLTDRVVGYGTIQHEGEVVDIPDSKEARRMIEAGQAEIVVAMPAKEAMTTGGGRENAMLPHNPQTRQGK